MSDIPLSLYIHYPYCERKCPYCDFNSFTYAQNAAYIDAVAQDLQHSTQYTFGRELQSIFLGGGTPSLMSTQELEVLFSVINQHYQLGSDIEITLEANPSSLTLEKLQLYKSLGINRISVGVQSFDDRYLQFLGRVHSSAQAKGAMENVATLFDNFNIDIIFGLQGQGVAEVESDLAQALAFAPSHLSFYQLTIEPNTYFAKHPPVLPDDERLYQMMQRGVGMLEQQGLIRYEVSAYGRPSKHNMNYWQFGDYIGVGAGAHGKITTESDIFRTTKTKRPQDYVRNTNATKNTIENLSFDFMLNALRLKKGFDLSLFTQCTGLDIASIDSQLKKAEYLELITRDNNILIPTALGFNHLNTLQELFL